MRLSDQLFPRNVVLIGTVSKSGKPNLMTASFVMPISFEPKIIAFAISPQRNTFKNLKEIPEFTMNILSDVRGDLAITCGSTSGKDTDKFAKCGVDPLSSKKVKPPVIDCPISFECKVIEMKEYGDHFLVIGEVVHEWARKENFTPLLHKSGPVYMKPVKL